MDKLPPYPQATRSDKMRTIALVAIWLVVSCACSYLLALAGHPSAYWLWHTILSMM